MNPFSNVISAEFLSTYNQAIDSILQQGALSIPCILKYDNGSTDYCNNCIYDQISKTSSNQYNNTGPSQFGDGTICPVCLGFGLVKNNNYEETLYLATIFDSKYFMNINNKVVNIPDGSIQTLCSSTYLPKIRSANELMVKDTEIYGSYLYQRAGDPALMGLGSINYISTLWQRK
jgi:hypothetical protein